MKKNRFFWASAAIAALTLTACADKDEFNQNDVQNAAIENSPGAIQFGTYLGKTGTTRAAVAQDYDNGTITNDGSKTLKKAQFGVFGYYTQTADWVNGQKTITPNFMYNQRIQYNDDGYWFYTPVKYWPNGIDLANAANDPSETAKETEIHKVSFFAYAPYTANVATPIVAADAKYTEFAFGDAPIASSVVGDYFKSEKYASGNGVVGMISWDGTANAGQSNDPWVNYVMNPSTHVAQASDVVDLLWGLRGQYTYNETDDAPNTIDKLGAAYNTDLTKQTVDEKVRFLFKHALAKVGGNTGSTSVNNQTSAQQCGLKVVLDVDDNSSVPGEGSDNQTPYQGGEYNATINGANTNSTLVTIKSVSIQDGRSASGDGNNAITDTKSDLINVGWFNLATGEWTSQAIKETTVGTGSPLVYNVTAAKTGTTYELNEDIKEPADEAAVNGLLLAAKTGWDNTKSTTGVQTTIKNVYADKQSGSGTPANDIPALVVIPSGNTEQTIYVTVDYFVRTADTQLSKGYSEVEQIISNEVKLKGLDANKYYTLVMHLGLTSVKFEAVVADWAFDSNAVYDENGEATSDGDPENKSVWLPSNVINSTSVYADAGTVHKHVTVADVTTAYTITLTGATAANDFEVSLVSCKDEDGANVTPASETGGVDATNSTATAGVANIVLFANETSKDIINEVKITEKSGSDVISTTTVFIRQQKAEIILTPSVTSIPWNSGAFTVTAKHANGTPYANLSQSKITITGAATGTTVSDADANGVITITPKENTTTSNRNIVIKATPYTDANVTDQITVVQAASTSPSLVLSINDPNTLIPAEGGSKTLTVALTNGTVLTPYPVSGLTVTVPAASTWLTWDGDTGKLTAAAYTSLEPKTDRSSTVSVSYTADGQTYTGTIVIKQTGTPAP